MKYTLSVDQVKSLEWGLNINQSHLFGLLTKVQLWASEVIFEGKVYYFASRQMIIKEIPLCYSKPNTVYKSLCILRDLELIEYQKFGVKDIVRLTDKGKGWNTANSSEGSDINPSILGNKSESNSEINPTYQYTSIDHITNYTYNSFYDSEIKKSGDNKTYMAFVDWLFRNNITKSPLAKVIALDGQVTFEALSKLLLIYDPNKIKETILDLENYTGRKYKSFILTITKWLSKTK